ncbi:MAG: enoyl-CoA hydratase/carnithine racemase [Dinoroseobacter sp.]
MRVPISAGMKAGAVVTLSNESQSWSPESGYAARQTKIQITRNELPDDLELLLRNELRYTGRGLASQDGREAVRAIFEKRKPVFTGP